MANYHRTYSFATRIKTLALYDVNRSYTEASEQSGISISTIRNWVEHRDELGLPTLAGHRLISNMYREAVELYLPDLLDLARRALEQCNRTLHKATPLQAMTIASQALDKAGKIAELSGMDTPGIDDVPASMYGDVVLQAAAVIAARRDEERLKLAIPAECEDAEKTAQNQCI